jgi:hypothetical protein
MRITKRDKDNFKRFGCSFDERTGIVFIELNHRGEDSNPRIFSGLSWAHTKSGPIVILAMELSSIRPLPQYVYFPFDISMRAHRKYLDHLMETSELRYKLISEKKPLQRTYRFTPYLRQRSAENYSAAIMDLESHESKYNFSDALKLMERQVRIPDLLSRLLLEENLDEILGNIAEALKSVPEEKKLFVKQSVDDVVRDFLPFYKNNQDQFLDVVRRVSKGMTLIWDLRRLFFDNPEGFKKFLVDSFAASLSNQEVVELKNLLTVIILFSRLPFKRPSSSMDPHAGVPTASTPFLELVQGMIVSGISQNGAIKFFELLGLETGGQPGPRRKDYSREYELKAKGLSWRDLARSMVKEDTELRDEFQGRDFDALSFEEKEHLCNRVRERIKNYAERMGKPFPIERFLPNRSEDSQETE